MDERYPASDVSDDELRDSMSEMTGPVSSDRASRFYDRMRERIRAYLEKKASLGERATDYLLLVPDIFMLLWRLVNDARVNAKNKVLLGSGIAYYLFPLDIMPEGLMGPAGYVDDLVFAVYLLNKVLADTDPEVVRKHWSGNEDILDTIQTVLGAADNLVGKDLFGRIKKMIR